MLRSLAFHLKTSSPRVPGRTLGLAAALALGACSSAATTIPDMAPAGPVDLAPVLYPSVSGIQPASVFLARTVDVTLSGYDTRWDANTKVDFGAGIKVNAITVASPAAIQANITISETATLGRRDVTVTEGTTGEPYKMAFQVESPVSITFDGTAAQGSILVAHIVNHDFLNPFDTTSMGDGFFTPLTFPRIDVSSSLDGTTVAVSNVQPFSIDATVTVDVKTAAGKADLLVASGPAGSTINFPAPASLTIAARTPTVLEAAKPATGTVADAWASLLYSYAPPEGLNLVQLDLTTDSMTSMPELILLPKSGAFADVAYVGTSTLLLTRNADPYYGVIWESAGSSNYPYKLAATVNAVTASATEKEPNDDKMNAQAATALPFALLDATLKDASDQDWIAVPVTMADLNKSVRVITVPGDPKTDTVVDVFDTDGVTSLGGPSGDTSYHEDFLSSPVTTVGTIYVVISASSSFVATHKDYSAVVRFQ